jgi:hypothetical protein
MAKARKPASSAVVYQFKIDLLYTKPPIWRRIQMADGTLDDLHEQIQSAFGWTNSHLHEFAIDKKRYCTPSLCDDDFGEMKAEDSTQTRLSNLFARRRKGFQFHYIYDFGDSWEHAIVFEGAVDADPKAKYPLCLDGARAGPPDDCGGVPGYYHLLEVLADSKHPEYEDMKEWVDDNFDPDRFDANKATKSMQKGLPNWRR